MTERNLIKPTVAPPAVVQSKPSRGPPPKSSLVGYYSSSAGSGSSSSIASSASRLAVKKSIGRPRQGVHNASRPRPPPMSKLVLEASTPSLMQRAGKAVGASWSVNQLAPWIAACAAGGAAVHLMWRAHKDRKQHATQQAALETAAKTREDELVYEIERLRQNVSNDPVRKLLNQQMKKRMEDSTKKSGVQSLFREGSAPITTTPRRVSFEADNMAEDANDTGGLASVGGSSAGSSIALNMDDLNRSLQGGNVPPASFMANADEAGEPGANAPWADTNQQESLANADASDFGM